MQISLFRSLISNWLGLFLTLIVGFFLSPYIVKNLGSEEYGIWALIVSMCTQFIVLDFGIRHSLVKLLAGFSAESEKSRYYVSSAFFLLLFLGLVGFLFFWLMSFFIVDWFHIPEKYEEASQIVFLILALDACIELLTGLYHGAIAARERWDYINAALVVRIVFYALFVIIAIEYSGSLIAMATAVFTSRLIYRFYLKNLFYKVYTGIQVKFSNVQILETKEIVTYGVWAFVLTFAVRVIYSIDVIIIGVYLTPTSVAVYAIALLVIDYFRMLLQSTSSLLVPRLSSLEKIDSVEEITVLVLKWVRLSCLFSCGIGLGVYFHGGDFIKLWVGAEYLEAANILSLLVMSYFITIPALSCHQYLLAISKHHYLAKLLLCEAIVNIVLSIMLVADYGLLGVAIGTVLPSVFFRGILLPILTCRLSQISIFSYIKEMFFTPLPVMIIYLILFVIVPDRFHDSWLSFMVENTFFFLFFCVFYSIFILRSDERAYLFRRLRASKI